MAVCVAMKSDGCGGCSDSVPWAGGVLTEKVSMRLGPVNPLPASPCSTCRAAGTGAVCRRAGASGKGRAKGVRGSPLDGVAWGQIGDLRQESKLTRPHTRLLLARLHRQSRFRNLMHHPRASPSWPGCGLVKVSGLAHHLAFPLHKTWTYQYLGGTQQVSAAVVAAWQSCAAFRF